jgi:O-antigen/teichoic acid export membrane protein
VNRHSEHPVWNLLAGTLTKYLFLAVTIAIGIFLMPFTIRHLGKEEYGLWMLVASMTAYFQLLDLGYGNGLVRQITQADARGDEEAMNAALSTFIIVYSAIGLIALLGVGALTFYVVPRFPKLTADRIWTAQWILAILGVRMAIGFPMSVFGAVTTARQRFALTSGIAIAVALTQALATYLLLTAGYGVVHLVAATTSVSLASYVAYAAAARRTFPGLQLAVSRFSRRHVREVTTFSLSLFLVGIAVHVGSSIDRLIVGASLGTGAVAVYAVAARLAEYQRQLCGQFSGLLFPVVVRFDVTRDPVALRATLVDGTRLALALVTGVTVCLLSFGRPLVEAWMGGGFEASVAPLYFLAAANLVVVAQGPSGIILLATGRERFVAAAALVEIALHAAASIGLVGRLGLTGVATGALVPYAVLNLAVMIPMACRSLGMPVVAFAVAVAGPAIVAAVPAVGAAALIRALAPPSSLAGVAASALVVTAVFGSVYWRLGLRPGERTRYAASLRRSMGPAIEALA